MVSISQAISRQRQASNRVSNTVYQHQQANFFKAKGVLALLFMLFSLNSFAQITVQVDRTDIAISESFKLIFVSDATVDDEPDFSPLNVFFKILNRSKSSNVSIVNGSISRKQTWSLTLLPKQVGKITVPSIFFGKDKSPPAILTVSKNSNAPTVSKDKNVFIRTEVDDNNVVVGQQILFKVKIYTRLSISSAQLSDPITIGFENVHAQLGASTQFSTTVNNINYTVLQQNYVITPKTAGTGSIAPIVLQAEIGGNSNRFFDPFSQAKTIKLQSNAVKVVVSPESTLPHKIWIPASKLKISSQIGNGPYKVGEPINLTITIEADKQLAELLPILPLAKHQDYKTYTDKPVFENTPNAYGINGKLIQKFAIIPQKTGEIVIPQYQVTWWNTQNNQFETAKTPLRTLQIAASDNPVVADPSKDIEPNTQSASNDTSGTALRIWQAMSASLLILWVATLWYFLKDKKPKPPTIKEVKPKVSNSKKALLKACNENNAKQAQLTLIDWGKAVLEDLNLSNIQQIKPAVSDVFQKEIDSLQQVLYSQKPVEWDGAILAKEVKAFKMVKQNQEKSSLKDLYPS